MALKRDARNAGFGLCQRLRGRPLALTLAILGMIMSQFWAKFLSTDGETFRLDTRIYLNDIDAPRNNDLCVGAIVGKNPGSAKGSTSSSELQPIELDGDKLLPTVRNIITKAYLEANTPLPERGYVQVLNLFYLCNPNLSQAIATIKRFFKPPLCKSEVAAFPWVWYVWGDESADLNPYKKRFSEVNTNHHFFFDNHAKKVKNQTPSHHEFAKHTQVLRHEYVVPHIAQIIANG